MNTNELFGLLVSSEHALQTQIDRQNPREVDQLIHDEFHEFGTSGGCFDKAAVVDFLNAEAVDMSSADFKLHRLADNVAVLTYRSVTRFQDGRAPMYSNRTSIWIYQDGRWQMRFHQGTPTKAFDLT